MYKIDGHCSKGLKRRKIAPKEKEEDWSIVGQKIVPKDHSKRLLQLLQMLQKNERNEK